MNRKKIADYIEDMLKVKVPTDLPIHFTRGYELYMSKIEKVKCVIVVSKFGDETTIIELKKDEPFIYVAKNLGITDRSLDEVTNHFVKYYEITQ